MFRRINLLPLVSVIIPTHNRAHIIKRAILSVLNQTYTNLELIVVDDASTDETDEVINTINDSRLNYIKLEKNRGANHARNVGLENAAGEYIAFQDSDDEWLNLKLEKQIDVMLKQGEQIGIVYTGFLRVEKNHARYFPSKRTQKSGKIVEQLLNGNFVTTQSVVIRRECLAETGGFDEQLGRLQDWDLFIRLAEKFEFYCIDEPLLIAYHSMDSISAKSELLYEALLFLYRKHEATIEAFDKKAVFAEKIGNALTVIGRRGPACRWYFFSLKQHPFRFPTYCYFFLSLTGTWSFNHVLAWVRQARK